MINPRDMKSISRSKEGLQEFLLFCLFCQRMNADEAAHKLEALLSWSREGQRFSFRHQLSPFAKLALLYNTGRLEQALGDLQITPFRRMFEAIPQIVHVDVETCTVELLQCIKHIGPKTARMFMIYGRGATDLVILDEHIMLWLWNHGYAIPASSPKNTVYKQLEAAFQQAAASFGVAPLKLDEMILTAAI
jgi:thermostable 8-oxoguanine DNA glycosylase